jgi:hypothetical protein
VVNDHLAQRSVVQASSDFGLAICFKDISIPVGD